MNLTDARSAYAGARYLERITALIRDSFAAIESARPGCFRYGDHNLRGTLERHVYHEATQRPAILHRLARGMHATGVRPDVFDYSRFASLPAQHEPQTAIRLREFVHARKVQARLVGSALRAHVVSLPSPQLKPEAQFVFCAIDERFLLFFEPFIKKLGSDRCALLCVGGPETEKAAARTGVRVLPRGTARPRLAFLHRPPDALMDAYAVAVAMVLAAEGALSNSRPRTLVFGEGASPREDAAARVARAAGIATVRVQHGRAGVIHPGYYDMQYDKMLMWGEGFADRVRPFSPTSRYVVTGSPLMAAADQAGDVGALLAFAAGARVVTVITQPESGNIHAGDYEALAEVVGGLVSSSPDAKVVVRLHPADRSTRFLGLAQHWPGRILVTSAGEHSLRVVLDASTMVLGLFSTVLSEAAALGVLPVVLRLGDRHRIFPAPEDEGAAVLAGTSAAAISALTELLGSDRKRAAYAAGMRQFARRYFGPSDDSSLERIVHHIAHPED
jgi:hypothetical protein